MRTPNLRASPSPMPGVAIRARRAAVAGYAGATRRLGFPTQVTNLLPSIVSVDETEPEGRRSHGQVRRCSARCHPKAMPVILTTPDEVETWMTAPPDEALKLQRPLPDGALRIVARGVKEDPAEAA
jgi:hypothetical protein